ncbi:SMI1/KNR4 family protein [Streptomyces sp. NPDC004244]
MDWAQAERTLGAGLPADYKQLVEEYGGPLWEHHAMGCLAFLLEVLTGTAQSQYFGSLREVLKPTVHRFATADETLGTAGERTVGRSQARRTPSSRVR